MTGEQTADYVIIGAGSAGCVLANRLSASGAEVILLEAGPRDTHPFIHIPAGVLKLLRHPVVNWNYASDPDPDTDNRAIEWPRGKTLGGSSSINGMLFIRGNRADFDRWAQMGARGWSYDDVLPYFKSMECAPHGDPEIRGQDGPLRVSEYEEVNPLTRLFIEAAQHCGHIFNSDLCGENPAEGVGYSTMSRNGRFRASTAQAFLKPARGRDNLTVETGVMALELVFDGRRCTGVTVRQKGHDRVVRARREVIVSAGTVNSPQLLQLSGIGSGEHLNEIGVPVRHELPGVGRNLSDHYAFRLSMRMKDVITINQRAHGWRLGVEVAKWALMGTGALTYGVSASQLYLRSRPELAAPDVQLLFTPASYDPARFGDLEREPGMTCAISIANPESRGEIMAKSPDPNEPPSIKPNYLSAPADVAAMLHGIRATRDIFAAPPFDPYRVAETNPGAAVQSDEDLEAQFRATGVPIYHIVGTCRAGEDPQAVVDPRLKVHGFDGLRVVDASIMPAVTTGNTNAAAIMIGEKGAAMILEDWAA